LLFLGNSIFMFYVLMSFELVVFNFIFMFGSYSLHATPNAGFGGWWW
jgi:hypothetical protein